MNEWHPMSNEEYREEQSFLRKVNVVLASMVIGGVVAGVLLGAILQIQVHFNFFKTWPKSLRFFTTPPGMVLIVLGVLLVLYKLSKFGRHAEASRPYFRAIGNYERGKQVYELWKKKGNTQELVRCRQSLQSARWCLKDVPEFIELWDKVEGELSAKD